MTNVKRPDFIGVGSEKAATGWIFECLRDHPEVCGNIPKEINFFNNNYNYRKGIDFYLSHFSHCPENKIKGEFSPGYLSDLHVPKLIHKFFPKIKIIICLRNPIEKIYSLYNFQFKVKERLFIYKTFEEAIEKDPFLLKKGFYYKQIKPYFDLFPYKNILVLLYDDLKRNPLSFLKELYIFLGLKYLNFIPPTIKRKVNVTGAIKVGFKIPLINKLYFQLGTFLKSRKFETKKVNIETKRENFFKLEIKRLLLKIMEWNKWDIYRKLRINLKKSIGNPPINPKSKNYLKKIYFKDIHKLEKLLDKDLRCWSQI